MGSGFREDERDEPGIGESRGKFHLARGLRKALRWRSVCDGCGSLGQVDGAQGALIQPEWIRGCEHTLDSPLRYVGDDRLTWRGSYDVQEPWGWNEMFRWRSRRKTHLTWTIKVPEWSGKTDANTDSARAASVGARMGTRCWSGGGREALSSP